jgi:hypothetical protein
MITETIMTYGNFLFNPLAPTHGGKKKRNMNKPHMSLIGTPTVFLPETCDKNGWISGPIVVMHEGKAMMEKGKIKTKERTKVSVHKDYFNTWFKKL